VPTLVISPWSAGGRVCSEVFDHTSCAQFLDAWLSARGTPIRGTVTPLLSSWRKAIAGDLTSAFDFERSVPSIDPGSVVDPARIGVTFTATQQSNAMAISGLNPTLKIYQADPDISKPTASKQDTSRCEILPLDYDFFVACTVDTKQVNYPITNRGKLGANFTVIPYDRTGSFPGDGPWFFSIEGTTPDKPVTIGAGAGAYAAYGSANATTKNYSYAVHGPNGYLFEFKGSASVPTEQLLPDITDAVSVDSGRTIRFTLKWPTANGSLKVINAYTGDFKVVEAGETTIDIATADGWYDVAFVDNANTSRWLRRYAGHLENGMIGKSDPAIGKQYDEVDRIYKTLTV